MQSLLGLNLCANSFHSPLQMQKNALNLMQLLCCDSSNKYVNDKRAEWVAQRVGSVRGKNRQNTRGRASINPPSKYLWLLKYERTIVECNCIVERALQRSSQCVPGWGAKVEFKTTWTWRCLQHQVLRFSVFPPPAVKCFCVSPNYRGRKTRWACPQYCK